MRPNTSLKFYKIVHVPALLYGSESFVLNTWYEDCIQIEEMRFSLKVGRLIEKWSYSGLVKYLNTSNNV